jgi:hypothetical protein
MSRRSASLFWCSLIATVLVVFRSSPFLAYEHLDFDSDQAIVGLMAKHLSEFRTFPLFFYGQHYMLGVQAWIAAPFYWLGGPTVAMLRMPLLMINAVVAVWLLRVLSRSTGSAYLALAAILPLAAATPVLSANLLETLGASIEPFLYVLALWALLDRPAAFGVVLGIGFLHREFTILALGGVVAVFHYERGRYRLADAQWAGWAALAFGAVWPVDQLNDDQHARTAGSPIATAPPISPVETPIARVTLAPSLAIPRLRQVHFIVFRSAGHAPSACSTTTSTAARHRRFTVMLARCHRGAPSVLLAFLMALRRGRRTDAHRTRSTTRPSPFCVYPLRSAPRRCWSTRHHRSLLPAILRCPVRALFLPSRWSRRFFLNPTPRTASQIIVALRWRRGSERPGAAAAFADRAEPRVARRRTASGDGSRAVPAGSPFTRGRHIIDFFARERVIPNSTEGANRRSTRGRRSIPASAPSSASR